MISEKGISAFESYAFFSHIHIISIDLPANKCYNFLIPIPKRSARLWIINESEEF